MKGTLPLMPAAMQLGLFGFSFDDPHERAAPGALVQRLALDGLPAVLAVGHDSIPLRSALTSIRRSSSCTTKALNTSGSKAVC